MADAYERHGRGHLDTIDVPLRRILFFDDTEENVDAARAIAKPALLVRSTADIGPRSPASASPADRRPPNRTYMMSIQSC